MILKRCVKASPISQESWFFIDTVEGERTENKLCPGLEIERQVIFFG